MITLLLIVTCLHIDKCECIEIFTDVNTMLVMSWVLLCNGNTTQGKEDYASLQFWCHGCEYGQALVVELHFFLIEAMLFHVNPIHVNIIHPSSGWKLGQGLLCVVEILR